MPLLGVCQKLPGHFVPQQMIMYSQLKIQEQKNSYLSKDQMMEFMLKDQKFRLIQMTQTQEQNSNEKMKMPKDILP